jgi:protein-disulfide isomerase
MKGMRYRFLPLLVCAVVMSNARSAETKKTTALDKPTLEAYIRHLFAWGPHIKVEIANPKPAPLPGMVEVDVHASAGPATQDEIFYVSKDGQNIVRGTIFDVKENPFKADLDKLKTTFQPNYGTPGAPVVLVLFSDFQCPYCKDEAKMLRANLLSAYPKQVRVYFMDLPLEQIHQWAKPASIAGRCIFKQNPDAFWQYHDWIYDHQSEITKDNLRDKILEFAKGKDIDALQLGRCMDTKQTESEVDNTIAQSRELRVNSTPTLFVNGRRLPAQVAWNDLRGIIDQEIEYQKTAKNAGEDCGCTVKLPAPGLN